MSQIVSSSIQTVTVGTVVATVRALRRGYVPRVKRLADYTADREFHPALKSLLGAKLQQITGIGKPRQQKPRGGMRLRAWGIRIMSIYSSVTPPAPAPQ